MTTGWECPRCRAINSPATHRCSCKPEGPAGVTAKMPKGPAPSRLGGASIAPVSEEEWREFFKRFEKPTPYTFGSPNEFRTVLFV